MQMRGFTLIELLIVVAIIAILAAIAVPNFLEAQTRSKVSRVKSDMRATATALEAYAVDHNAYPPPIAYEGPAPFSVKDPTDDPEEGFTPYRLTTPVAYISSLPIDVFEVAEEGEHPKKVSWHYAEQRTCEALGEPDHLRNIAEELTVGNPSGIRWMLFSHGPNLEHDEDPPLVHYDPTNGTVSRGDIYCFGPGVGLR
ncbi:MAG: prepilin-type N-terminal cleavage/methylation domain-containing protein [Candidatus Hydrogenedentota bacterium]|jgi:type II secretion system protein G|uniref:Type IV pilin PilA n=1 Tax=Sumerlaea chitinivorans TaxID=2250252 RepID=A0A2Z4Y4U9_SUMC1|nr:Type IV pilin PilA [Candidatus Sumerlaea chitinivorans]RMH27582.1 MAG: prepilin-type N-terminal cleavage/methylation domain-containing protein [Candidatus Hydrogenedentota bacterium]